MVRKKGTHTIEIYLEYVRCPECGFVNEDRQGYEYCLGERQKEGVCGRCKHHFMVKDESKPTFGPLLR